MEPGCNWHDRIAAGFCCMFNGMPKHASLLTPEPVAWAPVPLGDRRDIHVLHASHAGPVLCGQIWRFRMGDPGRGWPRALLEWAGIGRHRPSLQQHEITFKVPLWEALVCCRHSAPKEYLPLCLLHQFIS